MPWATFLYVAPHPCAPRLREVMAVDLSDAERRPLEAASRPAIEARQAVERLSIADVTAVKPRASSRL
jgi:hypothetical protein